MHANTHTHIHLQSGTHAHAYTLTGTPSALLSFLPHTFTHTHSCCHTLRGGQREQSVVLSEGMYCSEQQRTELVIGRSCVRLGLKLYFLLFTGKMIFCMDTTI